MPDLANEHYRLVTAQSYRVAICCLPAFERAQLPYVLIGGWACSAYGSPTPSVDTDIFLPKGALARLTKIAAEECGVVPNGKLEVLALDEPLKFTPRTLAEDRQPHSFRPDDALKGRTTKRTLTIMNSNYDVTVPTAEALAFLKLKALRDRRLAWEARTTPATMMTLTPDSQRLVQRKGETDWLRKVGKDLYDLAVVLNHTNLEAALAVADELEIRAPLEAGLRNMPGPITEFALALARAKPGLRVHLPST